MKYVGQEGILQGDEVRRVRMRGKFPDQSKMDMQQTADLFYGGPIPTELSPKTRKSFKLHKDTFEYYFEEGRMDDILESFEVTLRQVCFYMC